MTVLKVRPFGNSLGVVLPKTLTARLRVEVDDELFVIETEHGIELTPYDPDFESAMASFEKGRSKYRNALRELAKR